MSAAVIVAMVAVAMTACVASVRVTALSARPDLTVARVRVVESPMRAPELAAAFPDSKTDVGQGVDDPGNVEYDTTMRTST